MGLLNSPIAIVGEAIKKSIFEKSNIHKRYIIRQKATGDWVSPPPDCLYTSHFIHVASWPVFEWEKGQEAVIWNSSHLAFRKYKLILITKRTVLLMYLGFDATGFFPFKILIGWTNSLYHYKHFMFDYGYSCFLVTFTFYFFHIKEMENSWK